MPVNWDEFEARFAAQHNKPKIIMANGDWLVPESERPEVKPGPPPYNPKADGILVGLAYQVYGGHKTRLKPKPGLRINRKDR